MVDGEVVGRIQLGDERPVSAGDEDGALARGVVTVLLVPELKIIHSYIHSSRLFLFFPLPDIDSGVGGALLQLCGCVVLANAAKEGGRLGLAQNPLSHAHAVLGGAAGNVFNLK